MTCQAVEQRAVLKHHSFREIAQWGDCACIPCTAAHRLCRCSSRCARSPGPPEVEAGTVLSWMDPGGSLGPGLGRGWPGIRVRYRGEVHACPQLRRSAWHIWPAADRLSPAACARLSRCGCKVLGCSTASSSSFRTIQEKSDSGFLKDESFDG